MKKLKNQRRLVRRTFNQSKRYTLKQSKNSIKHSSMIARKQKIQYIKNRSEETKMNNSSETIILYENGKPVEKTITRNWRFFDSEDELIDIINIDK